MLTTHQVPGWDQRNSSKFRGFQWRFSDRHDQGGEPPGQNCSCRFYFRVHPLKAKMSGAKQKYSLLPAKSRLQIETQTRMSSTTAPRNMSRRQTTCSSQGKNKPNLPHCIRRPLDESTKRFSRFWFTKLGSEVREFKRVCNLRT